MSQTPSVKASKVASSTAADLHTLRQAAEAQLKWTQAIYDRNEYHAQVLVNRLNRLLNLVFLICLVVVGVAVLSGVGMLLIFLAGMGAVSA